MDEKNSSKATSNRALDDLDKKHRKVMGNRLRRFRVLKRLCQSSLAEMIGIAQNNLSRMENGIIPIKDVVKFRLSLAGCDLNWLITGYSKVDFEKRLSPEVKKMRKDLKKLQEDIGKEERDVFTKLVEYPKDISK